MAERQVTVKLSVKPDKAAALKAAYADVNKELDKQQEKLNRLNAAMSPDSVRRRATLNLKIGEAQKKIATATASEEAKQSGKGGGGVFSGIASRLGRLFGGKGGGAAAGEAGEAAGGAAEAGGAAGGIGAALGTIGAVAGVAVVAIGAVAIGLKKLGDVAVSTVSSFSPVTIKLFDFALQDLSAVIGERLSPYVEYLTKVFRLVGDTLETILPTGDEVRSAFSFMDDVLKDLRSAIASVAPLLKDVLIGGLKLFAGAIQSFTLPLRTAIAFLRGLGIISGEAKLKSSVGKAPRDVAFSGVEEYLKKVYIGALMSGRGATPEDKLNNAAENFSNAVNRFTTAVEEFGKWIRDKTGGVIGGAVSGATGGLSSGYTNGVAAGILGF
jgi:hypothetical protein